MTLADLKRKLVPGTALVKVYHKTFPDRQIGVKRYVVKVNTTGICLNEDPNAIKGSWLEWPKASRLEDDSKGFKVFNTGKRDLTPEEKKVLDEQPRDKEQERIDMMSDGSTMFYRAKRYFTEHGMLYLFTGDKNKRLDYNDGKLWDDNVKGDLEMAYEYA